MFRPRFAIRLMAVGVGLVMIGLAPANVWGQSANSASIVGKATDESGGAMPGVTIKATSPALQVAQVTTVTDTEGVYKLLDLPAPGVYRVSFELDGFQTFVREDVHLSVGFAGRVDAAMKIGVLTESVEVSGASPVVDTVSTTGSTTLQQEQLHSTPRGMGLLDLLPLASGVSLLGKPEVGDSNLVTDQDIITYGVRLYPTLEVEGINITSDHFFTTSVYLDSFSLGETVFKTSGNTADVAWPGVDMSSVMKSGGNDFHGSILGSYEHSRFQGNNITPALAAQGLSFTNPIQHYYDFAADLGGRIVRDKLWFYGGGSKQSLTSRVLGFVTGPDAAGCFDCPDATPGVNTQALTQFNIKLSYQVNPSLKLIGVEQHAKKYIAANGASRTTPFPSTSINQNPEDMWKGEIQMAPNAHLLIDGVAGYAGYVIHNLVQSGFDVPGNPASVDSNTGIRMGAPPTPYHRPNTSYNGTGTVSYLPGKPFLGGTHQLKAGTYLALQTNNTGYYENKYGDYQLTFVKGVPTTISTYNMPLEPINRQATQAVFATDAWSLNRVVLNLGVRWERYDGYFPDQSKDAGQFSVAGTFPGKHTNLWKDVVPRVGAAWDVMGNGKTVVKASFGMFGDSFGPYQAGLSNSNNLVTTVYSWVDASGRPGPCQVTNFNNVSYTTPNISCDATPATLASLKPTNTAATGYAFISSSGGPANLILNPNLKPDMTHEYVVKLERQLLPNVALSMGYVQHRVYNLYYSLEPSAVTGIPADTEVSLMSINTLRAPSDWTVATVKTDVLTGAPVTIYSYPSSKAGAAFNQFQIVNAPPNRPNYYHTFETSVTKRYSKRWNALASFWVTKNHEWIQAVSLSPNDDRFPVDDTWNWEARANITYYFPGALQLSSFFRAQSGFPGIRTELFTGIPQLSTVTLRMEPFGSQRGPSVDLLNLKLVKKFKLTASKQLELNFQVFNLLNTSAATSTSYVTSTFGRVNDVVSPRVARLGAYFSF